MKDRIILLIKAKNLTAAQFADEIGVQKSSISHILSGRNNASLDFIQKILLCYPEVSMEWLMFGKGPIFKSPETVENFNNGGQLNTVSHQVSPHVDLFSQLIPEKSADFRKENDLSPEPNQEENTKFPDAELASKFPLTENKEFSPESNLGKSETKMAVSGNKNITTKTILKIVEIYSDNTFREYFPE
jgi:transcriptional regulator with XRE-family HTH domain